MPVWKVLLIVVMFCACLGVAAATALYPMTMAGDEHKWLWLLGLVAATAIMGALFTLFLRKVGASMGR